MAAIEYSDIKERSLYDCLHARVKGKRIYCKMGYPLSETGGENGSLDIEHLARGEPLIMDICQDCADFESMGDPVPPEERGWLEEAPAPAPKREKSKVSSR